MVDYVSMAVLALHRDLVGYIAQQREQRWRPLRVHPATSRCVGVMGVRWLPSPMPLRSVSHEAPETRRLLCLRDS